MAQARKLDRSIDVKTLERCTKAELIGKYLLPHIKFPSTQVDIDLVGEGEVEQDPAPPGARRKRARSRAAAPPPPSASSAPAKKKPASGAKTQKKTQEALKVAPDRNSFGAAAKDSSCVICMEANCNSVALCCLSGYHMHCLAQWLEKGQHSCPSCREPIHWELEKRPSPVPLFNPFMMPLIARAFAQSFPVPNSFDDDDDEDEGDGWCHECQTFH